MDELKSLVIEIHEWLPEHFDFDVAIDSDGELIFYVNWTHVFSSYDIPSVEKIKSAIVKTYSPLVAVTFGEIAE